MSSDMATSSDGESSPSVSSDVSVEYVTDGEDGSWYDEGGSSDEGGGEGSDGNQVSASRAAEEALARFPSSPGGQRELYLQLRCVRARAPQGPSGAPRRAIQGPSGAPRRVPSRTPYSCAISIFFGHRVR